ncbi:MAG: GIY-YIG nuclease family protein [Gammaproteobacteria bacterium]|nr:GIY-YIG nuclease family protein [Gammaproteobacteria bacterium]
MDDAIHSAARTYALHIVLARRQHLTVGRLGDFTFPAGRYIYTGSARKNLAARVKRHLSTDKKLRWHIDYLLASPSASVVLVQLFDKDECLVNQHHGGVVVVPRFGASDCRQGCGSHLKRLS